MGSIIGVMKGFRLQLHWWVIRKGRMGIMKGHMEII